MKEYNIGRKVIYICRECEKHGRMDATDFSIKMMLRKRKGFE